MVFNTGSQPGAQSGQARAGCACKAYEPAPIKANSPKE